MSKYDVVIIGSGLGGLCTAYILAKHGMKVCVLEKNRQIGGSLQIYSRDKTIFETGVHYVGGLEEGQNLHSYFRYFNILKDLKLQKLNEDGFDVISFEGDDQLYPHAQGYDNFIERLAAIFPHEREALKLYVQKVKETCADFPMYNLSSSKKDFTNAWHLQIDSQSYINSIFKDPKLQKVIGGNNMLYAGVAGKSPFYVHALVVNSYIESSYRCIDGSSQIAKIMSSNIKAMGGEILNYHEASKFIFNGNEIESVELTNGERIEGKTFVSINLAGIIAYSGKKVVILDLDMRKPRIHSALGLDNSKGMSTLLIGKYKVEDVIQKTETDNLFVITAGPIPPNPSELLISKPMDDLLELLKKSYDVIIIDNPPVGLVTDGIAMLQKADYPIYVMRTNYSKREFIYFVDRLYYENQLSKLSIVLNGVDLKRQPYGYGYYGYGHTYGQGNYYEA